MPKTKKQPCTLSCSECSVRNCYRKEKQYPSFCLTEQYKGTVEQTKKLYSSNSLDGRIARAAAEIEGRIECFIRGVDRALYCRRILRAAVTNRTEITHVMHRAQGRHARE